MPVKLELRKELKSPKLKLSDDILKRRRSVHVSTIVLRYIKLHYLKMTFSKHLKRSLCFYSLLQSR